MHTNCIKGTIHIKQVCNIYAAGTTLEWYTTKVLKLCNIQDNIFWKNQPPPHIILAIGLSLLTSWLLPRRVCFQLGCLVNHENANIPITILDPKTQLLAPIFSVTTYSVPEILTWCSFRSDILLYKTKLFA